MARITFPESSRLYGRYILEPGEENESSIQNFSRNAALVVVVHRDDGEIISWVSANCDDLALVGLEVTAQSNPPGGTSAAYECY
ncbi:hypothetical protein [Haloarcula sp. JP-L23]|uniref:hypothetical protein n=1 Tax=Haloarcula sp. JP-L23 TaxID=2716717 RepID=UPI00140F1B5A|nr:hypothetical protein G9465_24150 [Haloarcula sp. JP-L23]